MEFLSRGVRFSSVFSCLSWTCFNFYYVVNRQAWICNFCNFVDLLILVFVVFVVLGQKCLFLMFLGVEFGPIWIGKSWNLVFFWFLAGFLCKCMSFWKKPLFIFNFMVCHEKRVGFSSKLVLAVFMFLYFWFVGIKCYWLFIILYFVYLCFLMVFWYFLLGSSALLFWRLIFGHFGLFSFFPMAIYIYYIYRSDQIWLV
jgi:hypothetical protein